MKGAGNTLPGFCREVVKTGQGQLEIRRRVIRSGHYVTMDGEIDESALQWFVDGRTPAQLHTTNKPQAPLKSLPCLSHVVAPKRVGWLEVTEQQ